MVALQGPTLGADILEDNPLCLHHSEQRARNVSFVTDVPGVDAEGAANLSVGEAVGRCLGKSLVDGRLQIGHSLLCEVI